MAAAQPTVSGTVRSLLIYLSRWVAVVPLVLARLTIRYILHLQLAEEKPSLSISVFGVLIVDEESGGRLPIGVDELMKHGELNAMKNGPLIWLDCADAQPNIGSGRCYPTRLSECPWAADESMLVYHERGPVPVGIAGVWQVVPQWISEQGSECSRDG